MPARIAGTIAAMTPEEARSLGRAIKAVRIERGLSQTKLAVAVGMSAGQFGFLYSAMASGMTSGLASLVLQAQALFTAVIAAIVLKERPTRVQLVGMAIALVGLTVVALGRSGSAP